MSKELIIIGYTTHCSSGRTFEIIHINKSDDYVLRMAGSGDFTIVDSRQISAFFETHLIQTTLSLFKY